MMFKSKSSYFSFHHFTFQCFALAATHRYVLYIAHQPCAVFLIQLFDLKLQLWVLLFSFLHLVLGAHQGLGWKLHILNLKPFPTFLSFQTLIQMVSSVTSCEPVSGAVHAHRTQLRQFPLAIMDGSLVLLLLFTHSHPGDRTQAQPQKSSDQNPQTATSQRDHIRRTHSK